MRMMPRSPSVLAHSATAAMVTGNPVPIPIATPLLRACDSSDVSAAVMLIASALVSITLSARFTGSPTRLPISPVMLRLAARWSRKSSRRVGIDGSRLLVAGADARQRAIGSLFGHRSDRCWSQRPARGNDDRSAGVSNLSFAHLAYFGCFLRRNGILGSAVIVLGRRLNI